MNVVQTDIWIAMIFLMQMNVVQTVIWIAVVFFQEKSENVFRLKIVI